MPRITTLRRTPWCILVVVESGGTASSTVVKAGGTEVIEPGGGAFATTVLSGGANQFVSGSTAPAKLSAGGDPIPGGGAGQVFTSLVAASRQLELEHGTLRYVR